MARSLNTVRGVVTAVALVIAAGIFVWRRTHPAPAPVAVTPAVAAASTPPDTPVTPMPAFKITGRDIPPALALLVDASTTDAQLETLINGFRAARLNGTLATLLPPTTPAAKGMPFGMVQIYVMSDPAYATDARLREFVHPKTLSAALTPFEEEFGKRVRAFYFFIAQGNHETGSIGLDEDGNTYGTNYRKLFGE